MKAVTALSWVAVLLDDDPDSTGMLLRNNDLFLIASDGVVTEISARM